VSITVLTKRQLGEQLQIGASTLDRLRAEGIIRSYRIRSCIRFVLEEVLEDLHKAESELAVRRIRGTFVKSGGPRRGKGGTPHLGNAIKQHTTVFDADEAEAAWGTAIAREKVRKEGQN